MRALLCVMNARRIPECLESYEALDIDVVYMTGFTVAELVDVHREIVEVTDFDVYLNVSDDCVVTPEALEAVLAPLEEGAPAATGWCRLHEESPWANVCHSPLIGKRPIRRAYPFYGANEVRAWPDPLLPTHFMGMSLTGLTRDLWLDFPYGCFFLRGPRGNSSDFHLSMRLRDAGVPMVAARDGYVEHMKPRHRTYKPFPPSHEILVGKIPQEVRFTYRRARSAA